MITAVNDWWMSLQRIHFLDTIFYPLQSVWFVYFEMDFTSK